MKNSICIFILAFIPTIADCQVHKLLKEIGAGEEDGIPNYLALTFWNNKIYFLSEWTGQGYSIWETDGTTENTLEITSAYRPSEILAIDDYVLFTSYEDVLATIHRMDGSLSGIETVKSFTRVLFQHLTKFNEDQIMFFAEPYHSAYPDTLWITDGTESGTINLGEFELISQYLSSTRYGDKMIFSENNGNGIKSPPVITDGTRDGTMLLQEFLNTGKISTAVGTPDFIFFKPEVENDTGKVFDGNTIRDMELPGDVYNAFTIGQLNIIFTSTSVVVYDGLTDSTYQIPVTPIFNYFDPTPNHIIYNNKVYFHGVDSLLYETDGTLDGTRQIAMTTVSNRQPHLFGYGNTIFYNAASGNKLVIRAYDLETNTDTIFASISPGPINPFLGSFIINIGERLLYKTWSIAQGREFFVYDPFITFTRAEKYPVNINYFPNPVLNELFLSLDAIPENAILNIFNEHGQKVLSEVIVRPSNRFNVHHFIPGIYFLQLEQENISKWSGSFIKQ